MARRNTHFQDRLPEALTAIDKALSIDPLSPVQHNVRALILQFLGNVDGAISEFKRAIELNPEFRLAYNNLEFIALLDGRYDLAAERFLLNVKTAPDSARLLSMMHSLRDDPVHRADSLRVIAHNLLRASASKAMFLYEISGHRDSALIAISTVMGDPVKEAALRQALLHQRMKSLRRDPRVPTSILPGGHR